MFGAEAFEALFKTTFVVTESSGRTGLRLKGSQILPMHRCELLTDGVPLGAMQVPPDGQPIILFVDQQTTGGYPKIANVIAADLHCVGQLPPKQEVRFSEVSIGEAIDLLRQQEQSLDDLFGE
jgi:antagonist of KipI